MTRLDSRTTTQTIQRDRQQEFSRVVHDLLPYITGRLEGLALYAMVAAFWGVILYLTMAFAVQ